MSATIREIVLKKIKTLLYDQVEVDSLTIPYYSGYFGNAEYGIYVLSYREEEDDNKHKFASLVTVELGIFGQDKTVDFVAEITRNVRQIIKASIDSTIQLSDGYEATITTIPMLSTYTELIDGKTTYRDVLQVGLRVDEFSDNS